MKKYRNTVLQVIVLSGLLIGSAVVLAFNGPTANPPGNNTPPPINQNGYGQYIGTTVGAPDISGVSLAILGDTAAGGSTEGSASSQFLNVVGTRADVIGTVTVSNLAGTGERPVCIGQDHKLKICNGF